MSAIAAQPSKASLFEGSGAAHTLRFPSPLRALKTAWYQAASSSRAQGPIQRLEDAVVKIDGKRFFVSKAFLKEKLRHRLDYSIYDVCDGTGISTSINEARAKAISEAIERWAFWGKFASAEADFYGFCDNPSSSGMAAYPEAGNRRVRCAAESEAIERFAIAAWWEGRLDGRVIPVMQYRAEALLVEIGRITAAILFRRTENGLRAYGRGAGKDWQSAVKHAYGELIAFELNLKRFRSMEEAEQALKEASLIQEKRMLYFAGLEGAARFRDRVDRPAWRPAIEPDILFNGPIPGPWSRFAKVWRCALRPVVDEHSKRLDIFSF